MATNAGQKILSEDAELVGLGTVKYDKDQIANILGFSHMSDKYRITYDNHKDDAFHVHTKNGIIRFVRDGRLYTYKPSQQYLDAIAKYENNNNNESSPYNNFASTIAANRDGYTDAQFERAKTAWKLYIATGGGGFENFKHYLRQNIIKNYPMTIEGVLQAEQIFVKDTGHLKGSTTRKNTKH